MQPRQKTPVTDIFTLGICLKKAELEFNEEEIEEIVYRLAKLIDEDLRRKYMMNDHIHKEESKKRSSTHGIIHDITA